MAYFQDLSAYNYFVRSQHGESLAFNVGWISRHHPFNTGHLSTRAVDAIWNHCAYNAAPTRGFHVCDICDHPPPLSFVRHGERRRLGTAEIRVFGRDGTVYAAPNLIYHYVADHSYAPPAEFIRALESGIKPGSTEYLTKLSKAVCWDPNPLLDEEPRLLFPGSDE